MASTAEKCYHSDISGSNFMIKRESGAISF